MNARIVIVAVVVLFGGIARSQDATPEAVEQKYRELMLLIEKAENGIAKEETSCRQTDKNVEVAQTVNTKLVEERVQAGMDRPLRDDERVALQSYLRYREETRRRQRVPQELRLNRGANFERLQAIAAAGARGGELIDSSDLSGAPAEAPEIQGTNFFSGSLNPRPSAGRLGVDPERLDWARGQTDQIRQNLSTLRQSSSSLRTSLQTVVPPPPGQSPLTQALNKLSELTRARDIESNTRIRNEAAAQTAKAAFESEAAAAKRYADHIQKVSNEWNEILRLHNQTDRLAGAIAQLQAKYRGLQVQTTQTREGDTIWTRYTLVMSAEENSLKTHQQNASRSYDAYQTSQKNAQAAAARLAQIDREIPGLKDTVERERVKVRTQASELSKVYEALLAVVRQLNQIREDNDVVLQLTNHLVQQLKEQTGEN